MFRKIISTIIIGLSYLAITACPVPLNTEMVNTIHDKISPEIEIYSPDENKPCANIVKVSGKVTDLASKGKGKIKQLTYQVPGFNISGNIKPEQNGNFQFLFETVTLGTRFTLNILAIDWNNNVKEISLSLHKIENIGIPSFKAEAGNQEITLSWEDVPGTDSYTLCYTTNKSVPWRDEENGNGNGTVIENVSSPVKLKNLKNGFTHTFILETNPKIGFPRSKSDELEAIPLSPQTLTPRVSGEYKQIRVEWNSIDGTNEFEVWRAFNIDGPYKLLSDSIEGNLFCETEVENNKWYFYKIKTKGSIFSHAAGAQSSPFPGTPQFIGMLAFDNHVDNYLLDIAIADSYLYIGDKNGKFYVVDIKDPQSPRLVKTIPMTLSACYEIILSGHYAYVACLNGGLKIIDISDPKEAHIVSSINTESAYGVAVHNSFAYVTDFNGKLHIVDISNPLSPFITKSINIPGSPYKVAVTDSYAYIISRGIEDYGLYILDLENSDSPEIINSIKSMKNCYDIVIRENYAFIAAGHSGVHVVDIQDPNRAEIIHTVETRDYAFDIKINNNSVYVAENDHGFQIIDITTPKDAYIIDSLETNGKAEGIAVTDTHTFIAAGRSGLQIFITCRPDFPTVQAKLDISHFSQFLTIHNSKLYIPMEASYLQIFDLNSPFKENTINKDPYYSARHIAFTGYFACITDLYQKFRIVNMNHIESPETTSVLDSLQIQNPGKMCIAGACALVTDGNGGLHLIDINNINSASIIKTISTPNNTLSVALYKNYAYIVDSEKGIFVTDISNPLLASLEKNIASTEGTIDIVISGDYAYTINYNKKFQVISLKDPLSPHITETINFEEKFPAPSALDVSGYYAYVTMGDRGLKIINIKNHEKPKIIKTIEGLGHTNSVGVAGSKVFVGNSYYELTVLDFLPNNDISK